MGPDSAAPLLVSAGAGLSGDLGAVTAVDWAEYWSAYWSVHWVAAAALALYTLGMLYNAYQGRIRNSTTADYYVGGRRLGGAVVGLSFFATFASTNSYIGHAGKGYAYGLPWLLMVVAMLTFTYLSWRFVAPRMRRFTAAWDCLTLPDFLVARFAGHGANENPPAAKRLRLATGLVILLSSLLYLVAVFKGAGSLLQLFLGVRYETAVGITLLIVVGYTSVGGFHSVVRTDVIQAVLMLVGAVTIFYFVTQAAGGVGVVWEMQEAPDTAYLFTADAGIPLIVLLGIALAGSLKLLVDPRQLSRYYGLKDERSVRRGMWFALAGIGIVQLCLLPVGLYAHQLLSSVADTDLIVPTLINDPNVFPLWVADLLIVAIVAAAMSSLDSVLLVAGSVLFNDVVAPLSRWRIARQRNARHAELAARRSVGAEAAVPSEPDALRWTPILVAVVAVVGALFALNPPGGIVEITIFAGSLYAVCFVPAVLFGLHWLGGNANAVLTSMVIGVLVLVCWLVSGAGNVVHEVFPALFLSTLAFYLVAKRQSPALSAWP